MNNKIKAAIIFAKNADHRRTLFVSSERVPVSPLVVYDKEKAAIWPMNINPLFIDNIVPLYVDTENVTKRDFFTFFYGIVLSWENALQLALTTSCDSAMWSKNAIKNMETLYKKKDIESLDMMDECAVVASGPSLNEATEEIVELDKIGKPIICCNSSFRKVKSFGVIPNYVLSADPRVYSSIGIGDENTNGTMLVCTYQTHPEVISKFKDVAVWSSALPVVAYVYQKNNRKITELYDAGTITMSMLDFAVKLGAKKIHVFGFDCAYADDGTYANSLSHDMGAKHEIAGSFCVKAIGGGNVKTDSTLNNYRLLAEEYISNHKDVSFINHSKTGAYINGMS